jgi:DNA-binding transcriptional regulator YhcF (GntR family)
MLNIKCLREQVYDFLKEEIQKGRLAPGQTINLNVISKDLGISKTPLRDALIQLETEGFVDILPRRGVVVRKHDLHAVWSAFAIVGALEAAALDEVFDRLAASRVERCAASTPAPRRPPPERTRRRFSGWILNFTMFFFPFPKTIRCRGHLPFKQLLHELPRRKPDQEWEKVCWEEHEHFLEARPPATGKRPFTGFVTSTGISDCMKRSSASSSHRSRLSQPLPPLLSGAAFAAPGPSGRRSGSRGAGPWLPSWSYLRHSLDFSPHFAR